MRFHPRAAGTAPFGAQTWDWHEELDPYWHVQEVRGPRYAYAGLAEHGMLAKIGMNSAGLGVFFNILGHCDDAATGVPVHVVAAAVLAEAGTVDEAVEFVETARVSASTALTLIDPHAVVCAELSPVGVATLRPQDGFLVHTNHFLDPLGAEREKPGVYDPDSQQRHALITARTGRDDAPADPTRLLSTCARARASRRSAACPSRVRSSGNAGPRWRRSSWSRRTGRRGTWPAARSTPTAGRGSNSSPRTARPCDDPPPRALSTPRA